MSNTLQPPKLNLVVLRFNDIDRAMNLYKVLGLTFKREQHGKGPEHFSCAMEGIVFEIYPRRDSDDSAGTRLGFSVPDVDDAVLKWSDAGGDVISPAKDSPWGRRAVVADCDGYRVELIQPAT